ncbi:MAG TPA: trypsin-like peptidase domain-containing protein [Candidatus Binatia bacterium]|nr:trypsin-like peptidase domain-containing protein [Candidatus Binatia bacterium]
MNRNRLHTLAALALLLAAPLAPASALTVPPPDVAAALAADAAKAGPPAYRFAVPVPVAVTPLTHGDWTVLADGRRQWRLQVEASGAKHLNFAFTRFALPAGASLTVAAADGSDLRGPYSAANAVAGQLWTPVVRGSSAVILLTLPAGTGAADLALTAVNYGFRAFGAKDDAAAKSGRCEIDVACPEAAGWGNEIRSVARYTIAGALLCSGTLMNNTARDGTPLFLTASHCLPSAALAPTTVYYWNYQTSTCGGRPDGGLEETQMGAVMLATSGGATVVGSDFSLLQLAQTPPAEYHVYYSGWDRRDLAPHGVVGIHHPNGDEKRISFDFDQTEIANYLENGDGSNTGSHIRVVSWDRGVTEPGSSGSGIWNTDHHLVGTLSGGGSSCELPKDSDWYGRLQQHWSAVPTPITSVADWLDPAASNADTLDGMDPAGAAQAPPAADKGSAKAGGALPMLSLVLLLGIAAIRRR